MDKEKFELSVAKLRPDIERLVRAVDDVPATCVTGFIFTTLPNGIVKFGNVGNAGDELINLHIALSALAAEMADGNPYGIPWTNLQYADIAMGDKPLGQAPEEIADALARLVLVTGLDAAYAAQAQELAQRYIQARRIPENGK